MDAHDQDSPPPNAVSPPVLDLERRGESSVAKNPETMPRLIGERDVPGEGPTLVYEDGTTCKKAGVNTQWINTQWSGTKAGCPRKRLAISCTTCREKKIKCDPAEPKCVQCARLGRDCWLPTMGPRKLGDELPNLTKEAQRPEHARFLNSEQPLNEEVPRPSLSAGPETSKTTIQRTPPVHILAHNLSLSPQSRNHLPEWVPQQAGHGQSVNGSLSAAVLQPLRTYGTTPLHTLLAKYYLLDRISKVKMEDVKSCLDAVDAERPVRPLAESVALLNAKPPKVWLAIRRMIRNPYFDNLYVLDIIFDAKLYTDYVLSHALSRPILGPIEQMFACPALFDCIRVRQYMLNMLFREIQVFVLEVDIAKNTYLDARFLSNHQSPAKSVPVGGTTQVARKSKRWHQISSQRIWDHIRRPTVQGKPRNRVVNSLC